jgi:hypothetical protein
MDHELLLKPGFSELQRPPEGERYIDFFSLRTDYPIWLNERPK